ncbi:hypothetical protein [Flavobacterium salmonis]|uniref:Transcriptional regulator PadR-like family protein n=1 Tax=Flavobacterium salmonis TaxID=2654844 RepID=A0A6V6ZEP3_9FLAO|nr:hypothetical protein [Flavobacterium salmonis]CAD0009352.1 hypothetical protein FLAT13_04863 [Flavobacterium salmonis]
MLTKKQILILFLISGNPGIRGIYTLMKFFDRADFPSDIMINLNVLVENNFIIGLEKFENSTDKNYMITKNGENFLSENFSSSEIIDYIKTMDDPTFMLELTKAYIDKIVDNTKREN